MALTFDEKIAIAKMKAEGLTPYAIAKRLGWKKDRVYRALTNDKELQALCEEIANESESKCPKRY
jgi:IS30 family transposase